MFLQFLMLNISSIKELLHNFSEIHWNITGTLPGKLKWKCSWALSYKILPPEITKMGGIAILGGTLGTWEQMWNSMFFMILWIAESFSLYLLVTNSFNFILGFSLILNIFWRVSSEKNILRSVYHTAKWYWCKKDKKNLQQTSHNFFSQCLIKNYSLLWAFMVQNSCKNSFSGGKSRKKGIFVIKITFSLLKIP